MRKIVFLQFEQCAQQTTGTVNCRDLLGLARGLRALPAIKNQLQGRSSAMLQQLEKEAEDDE